MRGIARSYRSSALAGVLAISCLGAGPVQAASDGRGPSLRGVVGPLDTLDERRWAGLSRQRRDVSCGAASLHTLVRHDYGSEDAPAQQALLERMVGRLSGEQRRAFARHGFSFADIRRQLNELGFAARGLEVPLATLLEMRAPSIVHLSAEDTGHFVVWRGAADGHVYIADPARGNTVIPVERFARQWSGYVLVPAPRGEAPKEYARADIEAVIASW